uniref:Uncharacterized protein n=1 Tax=Macrostomum lignano TaxID=282301 RepID=A0A1I8HY92_9PLAT
MYCSVCGRPGISQTEPQSLPPRRPAGASAHARAAPQPASHSVAIDGGGLRLARCPCQSPAVKRRNLMLRLRDRPGRQSVWPPCNHGNRVRQLEPASPS